MTLNLSSGTTVDANFLQAGDVVLHKAKPRLVTHVQASPTLRVDLWHHGRTVSITTGQDVSLLLRDNVTYVPEVAAA